MNCGDGIPDAPAQEDAAVPRSECCGKTASECHAPGCLGVPKKCVCEDPLDKGVTHRTDGPCFTTPPESAQERLARVEQSMADGHPVDRADAFFLLSVVRQLGDRRIHGLREAAGLVRAAKDREVTTRFLAGKKEQVARAMNSKLMDTVAKLIDRYADDAAAGKV